MDLDSVSAHEPQNPDLGAICNITRFRGSQNKIQPVSFVNGHSFVQIKLPMLEYYLGDYYESFEFDRHDNWMSLHIDLHTAFEQGDWVLLPEYTDMRSLLFRKKIESSHKGKRHSFDKWSNLFSGRTTFKYMLFPVRSTTTLIPYIDNESQASTSFIFPYIDFPTIESHVNPILVATKACLHLKREHQVMPHLSDELRLRIMGARAVGNFMCTHPPKMWYKYTKQVRTEQQEREERHIKRRDARKRQHEADLALSKAEAEAVSPGGELPTKALLKSVQWADYDEFVGEWVRHVSSCAPSAKEDTRSGAHVDSVLLVHPNRRRAPDKQLTSYRAELCREVPYHTIEDWEEHGQSTNRRCSPTPGPFKPPEFSKYTSHDWALFIKRCFLTQPLDSWYNRRLVKTEAERDELFDQGLAKPLVYRIMF